MNKIVIVALSGGIDSTIAAYLLKKMNFNIIAATFITYDNTLYNNSLNNSCFMAKNKAAIKNAEIISKKLKIDLIKIDVRKEFKKYVFDYFTNSYQIGFTPNPCVKCNEFIKFNIFYKKLKSFINNDFLYATGHYVKKEFIKEDNIYLIKKAKDIKKDQSYFLYAVNPDYFKYSLFPLGKLKKEVIRKLAYSKNLYIKKVKESSDFISLKNALKIKENNFFTQFIKEGNIYHIKGKLLGKHKGIFFYTIGQRKGLNISYKNPLYVYKIEKDSNSIIVAEKEYLYKDKFIVNNLILHGKYKKLKRIKAKVKIRYNHKEQDSLIKVVNDNSALIEFKEKQFAITPGQSAVFYKNDLVIGGGIINKVIED